METDGLIGSEDPFSILLLLDPEEEELLLKLPRDFEEGEDEEYLLICNPDLESPLFPPSIFTFLKLTSFFAPDSFEDELLLVDDIGELVEELPVVLFPWYSSGSFFTLIPGSVLIDDPSLEGCPLLPAGDDTPNRAPIPLREPKSIPLLVWGERVSLLPPWPTLLSMAIVTAPGLDASAITPP